MPLFTIFIAGKLQAALPLYWIVTSVFTIVQQWWMLKDKNVKFQMSNVKKETKAEKIERKQDKKARKHGVEVTVRKKGDNK